MDPAAKAHFEETALFREAEVALAARLPGWIPEGDEDALRYALSLARLRIVPDGRGGGTEVAGALSGYRAALRAELEAHARLERPTDGLPARAGDLRRMAAGARASLLALSGEPFGAEALDREVCERALVLVCGGGGGSGLIYLGAFTLLEEMGLAPRLIVGTSMGSLMGFFRALTPRWDPLRMPVAAPKDFTMGRVLRPLKVRSRYGLPGLLRLDWRETAEAMFAASPWGRPPALADLALPLYCVATGIRRGFEEEAAPTLARIEEADFALSRPSTVLRGVRLVARLAQELAELRPMMKEVVLGADALTRAMPAADAVGFSCAVPGLLHYDVPSEDGETERVLDALFAREDLARLIDGGVVSNVPARAAWEAVERGVIGTRNACILAFDAFAPRVRASANTLFMGIQELARMNVLRQRKYATYTKTFRNVPSPLEFLGHLERYMRIAERGYAELSEDRGPLARLMRPIPPESVLA